jgi:hypothetical protein
MAAAQPGQQRPGWLATGESLARQGAQGPGKDVQFHSTDNRYCGARQCRSHTAIALSVPVLCQCCSWQRTLDHFCHGAQVRGQCPRCDRHLSAKNWRKRLARTPAAGAQPGCLHAGRARRHGAQVDILMGVRDCRQWPPQFFKVECCQDAATSATTHHEYAYNHADWTARMLVMHHRLFSCHRHHGYHQGIVM